MRKPELSLGDALRLGSAIVPAPYSMEIERCGIGMIYQAFAVRSADCGTLNLLYPGLVDKAWPCPWCAEGEEVHRNELAGASVVQHSFGAHYLTGQISMEDLARWLDFIGTDPHWNQLQEQIGTMPKFSTNEAKGNAPQLRNFVEAGVNSSPEP